MCARSFAEGSTGHHRVIVKHVACPHGAYWTIIAKAGRRSAAVGDGDSCELWTLAPKWVFDTTEGGEEL